MAPDPALHIVQIAPIIAPGSGVAMVAYALEQQFAAAGCHVERFTLAEARGTRTASPRSGLRHVWDVVWFSTIGTRRARRFLAERPHAVTICHNDAMVGDIYVNHGLLRASMRARRGYLWRMLRNPLHLYTAARDRRRYLGGTHRAVVALSSTEARLLRELYGSLPMPVTVIGNGVDLERFRPPTPVERAAARARLDVAPDSYLVMFIGNEFDRKGLPQLIDALPLAPADARVVVVGGTSTMIRRARRHAERRAVRDRIAFVGPQPDVVPFLHAADALVLASAYEANALVLLEAMAAGVPVIATPVGVAPDIIQADTNGCLVSADPRAIAEAVARLRAGDRLLQQQAARDSAVPHSWPAAADAYLRLARSVLSERHRD